MTYKRAESLASIEPGIPIPVHKASLQTLDRVVVGCAGTVRPYVMCSRRLDFDNRRITEWPFMEEPRDEISRLMCLEWGPVQIVEVEVRCGV